MPSNQNRSRERTNTFVFEIPKGLDPYAAATVTRLGYIFSDITFKCTDNEIVATAKRRLNEEPLRKEIAHTLYREKIYQETLPARLALIRTLTR